MKLLTKGVLTAAILMTPVAVFQEYHASAKTQEITASHHVKKAAADDLDISQGWDVTEYTSEEQPDVNKVFLQNNISGNQKGVFLQVANMGDATFTAKRVLNLKKGHTYDLDFIYAQEYTTDKSTGYIDFNGETFKADSDSGDKSYKKTIVADADMDFVITISFKTVYPDNAYFKLGYDMTTGDGITDTPAELEAPLVNPNPEAGTNVVSGTADKGNTVEVTDSNHTSLGTATVADDGTYTVNTSRALKYRENLNVIQKNKDKSSPATVVEVVDTIAPEAPVLDTITDEDMQVSGMTEPYANVFVTFDTGATIPPTYEGLADENGKFTIKLDQTYDGNTKLSAIARDEAGHESDKGNGIVLFAHPLTIDLGTRHITSNDTRITGTTSRPNCDVTVEFGARIYTGKSDADGKFTITIDKHPAGTEFTVKAVDPNDKENPAEVTDKVYPRIPNLETLTSGLTSLNGVADPGAEISLKLQRGSTTYEFKATADAQGNFTIPLKDSDGSTLSLAVGDKLTFQATLTDLGLSSDETTITIHGLK